MKSFMNMLRNLTRSQLQAEVIQLREQNAHQAAALNAIIQRTYQISVPNGTTKVLQRMAEAGVTGGNIKEAAQFRPRFNKSNA